MKLFTIVVVAMVCLVQPAAAEEAVHLRLHADEDPAICTMQCKPGQYCANGTKLCRGPRYSTECFNPAEGAFQDGCSDGFACKNGKCDFA